MLTFKLRSFEKYTFDKFTELVIWLKMYLIFWKEQTPYLSKGDFFYSHVGSLIYSVRWTKSVFSTTNNSEKSPYQKSSISQD